MVTCCRWPSHPYLTVLLVLGLVSGHVVAVGFSSDDDHDACAVSLIQKARSSIVVNGVRVSGDVASASATIGPHPPEKEPQSHFDVSLDDGQLATVDQANLAIIEDAPPSILALVSTEQSPTPINSVYLWLGFVGIVSTTALVLSLPLPPAAISYLVCVVYIIVSVTIDLTIATQKTSQTDPESEDGPFKFNTKCAVVLTELLKLVVSLGLAGFNSFQNGKWPDVAFSDVYWLVLPAIFFTANNVLVYLAIGMNKMATFGVFRDTMILWTALIWRAFFQTELGSLRLSAIMVIFLGLTLNRSEASSWSWAFLWVLLMTLANSVGSVVNEFALKRSRKLDINVQNTILYIACASFAILLLVLDEPKRLMGPAAFFHGFTGNTFFALILQAFAGLMVSRMLKYADSVTKTVACCLRGPVVVFISPYLLGVANSKSELMSSIIVATGCLVYLMRGPLAQPPPPNEEAGKNEAK